MPNADVVEIAEAVKVALNAATLSQSFTAERAYAPVVGEQDEDADEFAELKVTVVAVGLSMVALSRRDDDFDHVVNVAVQKRIGSGPMTNDQVNAACDPLVFLTQEIIDLFRGKRLATYQSALCVAVEIPEIANPGIMEDDRVFSGLARLTFRKERAE